MSKSKLQKAKQTAEGTCARARVRASSCSTALTSTLPAPAPVVGSTDMPSPAAAAPKANGSSSPPTATGDTCEHRCEGLRHVSKEGDEMTQRGGSRSRPYHGKEVHAANEHKANSNCTTHVSVLRLVVDGLAKREARAEGRQLHG